jgi:hypothetical protein
MVQDLWSRVQGLGFRVTLVYLLDKGVKAAALFLVPYDYRA